MTDNEDLSGLLGGRGEQVELPLQEFGHKLDVLTIQKGIHFVHQKHRRSCYLDESKDKSEGSDGFLTAGEKVQVDTVALTRWAEVENNL